MGQAKSKGSYDQRVEAAKKRDEDIKLFKKKIADDLRVFEEERVTTLKILAERFLDLPVVGNSDSEQTGKKNG